MFDVSYMIQNTPKILEALPRTLLIAVISMSIGLVLGLLLALIRLNRVKLLEQLATLYISFFRGTPVLVQMYLIFYSLPYVFMYLNEKWQTTFFPEHFSPLLTAIIIFSLNITAYVSEAWYAGLDSVEYGQVEAGQSVGMTWLHTIRHIILPQALVNALPNFGNAFIGLIKGTSLAFSIQVVDLMAVAKIQAGDDYRYLEMYAAVSLIYWGVCFLLERLFIYLEKRFSKFKTKTIYV
ncbi:amino acid ABC transporter permease [Ureibacillus composti]|nr:amino acid ABC transporter permease [Ureibacillus composti]